MAQGVREGWIVHFWVVFLPSGMAQEGGLESYMNNYLMFFNFFLCRFLFVYIFFSKIFFEICHEAYIMIYLSVALELGNITKRFLGRKYCLFTFKKNFFF